MNKYIMILPVLVLMGCVPGLEASSCNDSGVQETAKRLTVELLDKYRVAAEPMLEQLMFMQQGPVKLTLVTSDLYEPFDKGAYDKDKGIRYCEAKIKANVTTGDKAADQQLLQTIEPLMALSGGSEDIRAMFDGVERSISYTVTKSPDGDYIEAKLD